MLYEIQYEVNNDIGWSQLIKPYLEKGDSSKILITE